MSNELAKPESFQEIVRDRVRKIVMEAVPDDQIDALIKKEYTAFFEDRVTGDYRKEIQPSLFKKMVNDEIVATIRVKVKEYVATKCNGLWSDEIQGPKLLEDVCRAFAPAALDSIMQNIVSVSLSQFKNNFLR